MSRHCTGLTIRPQALIPLHVEHIIPRKHRGTDAAENLALACIDGNLHKSCNLTGFDPETGVLAELFHPRRHHWDKHFDWRGVLIVGRTPIGRATVKVPDFDVDAARAVLRLGFSDEQKNRMIALADQGNRGGLPQSEQDEMDRFRRVGNFLALMHSKARLSLKHAQHQNG